MTAQVMDPARASPESARGAKALTSMYYPAHADDADASIGEASGLCDGAG